jgi:hypothetical protein
VIKSRREKKHEKRNNSPKKESKTMLANIFVKSGKKFDSIQLPALVAEYLYNATVNTKATDRERELGADVLSSIWESAIVAKYAKGDSSLIDRVEISGFEVTRNVSGESVSFEASATISNLNMTAMLAGIAKRTAAKQALEAEHANVKALIKSAVSVTVKGYNAGKRGRTAKQAVTREQATAALLDALK